jgi:hypothetical protein
MKKVSWWVKVNAFDNKRIQGELLGFVKGWFFTYAIINPLENCYEGENLIYKGTPIKIKFSKINVES